MFQINQTVANEVLELMKAREGFQEQDKINQRPPGTALMESIQEYRVPVAWLVVNNNAPKQNQARSNEICISVQGIQKLAYSSPW